jgi:hypothetical protein
VDVYMLPFVPQVNKQFLSQILTSTFVWNQSVDISKEQRIMAVEYLPQGALIAKPQG